MPLVATSLLAALAGGFQEPRDELFRFDRLDDVASYAPSGMHAPKVEAFTTPSFGYGLRATVDNPGNPWDAQIGRASLGAVRAGDAIRMTFSARTTGSAAVLAVFEQREAPNAKTIYQIVGTDGTWRDFRVTRATPSAYAAGEASIKFFFTGRGTVELGNVAVTNLGGIAGPFGLDDDLGAFRRERDEARLRAARANIAKIRRGRLALTVLGPNGRPLAGRSVRIRMTRPAFRWGTAVTADLVNADTAEAKAYRAIVAREFNTVVFENDLKWTDDPTRLAAAERAAGWLRAKGIEIRGHNLVWGAAQYLPKSLSEAPPEEKWPRVRRHVEEYATRMKGKVYVWDVVNEAVTNTALWDEIGWDKFADVYRLARAADPKALLAYNDYNNTNAVHRRTAIARVKALQAAGAPVDLFGDQGHFGFPEPSAAAIVEAWDEIARETRLPIEITEYDFGTPDDAMYAEQIEDVMTLAYGHPAIRAFVMWGFWEGAHWRANEGGAIVRRDFTYRAPMRRFHELVHRTWSTDATLRTDANGRVALPAFYGTYHVEAGTHVAVVRHPSGATTATVRMKAATP